MKNLRKNARKIGLKTALVFGLFYALTGCAQKPVLPQVSTSASETPINSPAQAEALVKMHSK